MLRRGSEEHLAPLRKKRIGLVTNHTGRAADGTPTLRVLRDELDLAVVALFSPEHGFTGDVAAGDAIVSDASGELPIFSLYGDTRAPTEEMLADIDVLVFDIQDVGVRFYTYISTMKLSMDAAAESGIDFVVLDRPNPNGGVRVEGPVLEPGFSSFVGIGPIALLHGMTVGELARFFATDASRLHVVPILDWRRDAAWEDTGLDWIAPSPNLRTVQSALAFPAFGLLEGVNVSEGRGIDETFERMGAPWIDAGALAERLNRLELEGVSFEATSFIPRAIPAAPRPKYENERCFGVALTIDDRDRFDAVRTGLEVIAALRALHPRDLKWIENDGRFWIDLLLGTDGPRRAIDVGVPPSAILAQEQPSLERFLRVRADHLLY